MRVLIQRVSRAQAHERGSSSRSTTGVGKGLLVLAGFEAEDSPVCIEQMIQKIRSLRIFSDASGKMNVSGHDAGAQYLLVSQFTLYADCRYGNRPSFDKAAPKTKAKEYFEYFVQTATRVLGQEVVRSTPFGADLEVELVNDGPVTIWMDTKEIL